MAGQLIVGQIYTIVAADLDVDRGHGFPHGERVRIVDKSNVDYTAESLDSGARWYVLAEEVADLPPSLDRTNLESWLES